METTTYNALFGALTQEHRLDVIANNLANVNTTGYKKDNVAFHDVFVYFAHDRVIEQKPWLHAKQNFPDPDLHTKVRLSGQFVDQSQGAMRQTGNKLDLAIQGEGFFKVQMPDGRELYTRDGSFQLSSEGVLVDKHGNPVMSEAGIVGVPQGAELIVGDDGQILVDGNPAGQLQIVSVDDPKQLIKIGENYMGLDENATAQEVFMNAGFPELDPDNPNTDLPTVRTRVLQGFLESSNVNVVEEMVNMIEAQRAFESYNKIMQSGQQLDAKLMGMASK
jgi:flagellar basal-body rod protein FlgG